MAAKLEDVIERLKTEGYLNRFKSKYSIKSLQEDLGVSAANLMHQTNILQEMLDLQKEQAKDAERQNKLLFGKQSNSAPTVPKPQASSSDTSSGGGSGGEGDAQPVAIHIKDDNADEADSTVFLLNPANL